MRTAKAARDPDDIVFVFKYVNVNYVLTSDFYDNDADRAKIDATLDVLQDEIRIDKTYVNFSGTKFEKVFLTEGGWKELCKCVYDSNFGKTLTKEENTAMFTAYRLMIICYIAQCFIDLGWDISEIQFFVEPDNKFTVEYERQGQWVIDMYPGPWQDWD